MHTPRRLDQHHVKTLRTSKIRLSNDFTKKMLNRNCSTTIKILLQIITAAAAQSSERKTKRNNTQLFVKKLALCVSLTSSYFFPAP